MKYTRFFTYLSFYKIFNILLVFAGYTFSLISKKVFIWSYPYAVSIETSAICNLKCPECPTGNSALNREQGLMLYTDFFEIINQIKKYTIYLNMSLQGEPFLNKNLFKMIQHADKNKIITSLSTNGHFIDSETAENVIQSGLKRLIISVDGIDQETYEKYRRGGSLMNVLGGIKKISELKHKRQVNNPEIVIQFIVFRHNEHQINDIKNLGKQIGADKVELKSAQINDPENNLHLLTTLNRYSRYKINKNKINIKNKLRNRCFRIWETMVITWDGTIISCCFDKDAQNRMGNMKDSKLYDVWKSLAFNKFRKKILTERKKITICCNCTEGLRIKY